MEFFPYKKGALHCEGVALEDLANQYGTPLFVYSQSLMEERLTAYKKSFEPLSGKNNNHASIFYAVKANSNLSILRLFHQLGAGFDTVSVGEMKRALLAGAKPQDIVFAGVGKSAQELIFALQKGIGCISIESIAESKRLQKICADMKTTASVAVRINPDIVADTHPSIRTGGKEHKFGVPAAQAIEILQEATAHPYMEAKGISCHIGSQILTIEPFILAAQKMREIYKQLQSMGIKISQVSLGGGFGVSYNHKQEKPLPPEEWHKVAAVFADTDVTLALEPGRSLVAAAGILLMKIEYLKNVGNKKFVITDGAMNDMLRPALYNAYHEVVEVKERQREIQREMEREMQREIQDASRQKNEYDITGPVCESGDILALQRQLTIEEGDLLALLDAGAYGMSMSSNYNSRPRAAEVLVKNNEAKLIRRREGFDDMIATEKEFI